MKLATSVVALCATSTAAQNVGHQKQEKHPHLTIQHCTKSGGCKDEHKSVVIDANWRWTHQNGNTNNCYTGNEWDKTHCPDGKTCAENCAIDGADEEYEGTYGVKASGHELKLSFVTQGPYSKNIGSRLFLMESEDKYKMFNMKNKEFTFDVDVANLPCGLNGALYFVQMDEDGGLSRYSGNKAGAKYGTGYCDAQCPHDVKFIAGEANCDEWVPSKTDANAGKGKYGSCCVEFDVWESNSISTAFTAHACNNTKAKRCESPEECGDDVTTTGGHVGHRFDGICDKNGCDYQPWRLGQKDFWGPGPEFTIDTTKTMRAVTQFITHDHTDTGRLVEVRRTWRQGNTVIHTPSLQVGGHGPFDSLTKDYCTAEVGHYKDHTNFLEKGGFDQTGYAFEQGMVLALSMWDDHEANMLWLDSTYPIDSPDAPGAKRGTCPTSSGDPKDVEEQHPDAFVRYMNIKYGEIGSTDVGSIPAPSPPAGGFSCGECAAHGFGEDQCDCGYCSSYGGCGWTCGQDSSHPPAGPQCQREIHCSECSAHGYGEDQCNCGYCGSYGGCGWTCGKDASQKPLGPKCTVASAVEV